MRTAIGTGLRGMVPALASVLALALLLLWPADASAAPSVHTGHHHASRAAQGDPTATILAMPAILSMPAGEAPCHQGGRGALPPCCAGLACVAMHVGLAVAASGPLTAPSGGADRPAGGALLEGVGVPPDLPPPRLG